MVGVEFYHTLKKREVGSGKHHREKLSSFGFMLSMEI